MEKQKVLNALNKCLGYNGHCECGSCEYVKYRKRSDMFCCCRKLYADVATLLDGTDGIVSVDLEKALREGK